VAEAVRRLLDDEDAHSRALELRQVHRATDGARATADFLDQISSGVDMGGRHLSSLPNTRIGRTPTG
jgi:hypothetical protein